MASQTVESGHTDPFPSLSWLNAGIIHLTTDGWLTVYNNLAVTLLDIHATVGKPVRLEDCLSPYREEYKLLHHIISSRAEVRNQLITWAENGQIRHVLIDAYRADRFSREDGIPLPAGLPDFTQLGNASGNTPGSRDRNVMDSPDSLHQGMCIMMKDLGDFVLLDQHLQRTDKLAVVGKVAAGVAHEIRNPLTTVRGFLQVMNHRFTERKMEEEQEYIRMMVDEVDKVENLVKELLLLSKPHRSHRTTCNLGDLLHSLESSIRERAQSKGITSIFSVADNIPAILGDEELLTHVINQLIENAIDAMESGGELCIKLSADEGQVRLDVHDTGPGIPYYQMDQVFDAFFTTKDKGTGLGLPISKKIIADHGGEIYVSSKGFGTTFSVILPNNRDAV